MAITHVVAEDVHEDLLIKVMSACHSDLVNAGVKVTLLFAEGGEDKEGCSKPALKENGYVIDGVSKIPTVEQRAAGMCDLLLIIDIEAWKNYAKDEQRVALLDQLLASVYLSEDKDGQVKLDTAGRPKLVRRRYTHRIGVFEDVAERNGIHTPGFAAIKNLTEGPIGQMWLPFFELGSKPKSRRKAS